MQYKGTFEFAEYNTPPNPIVGGLSSGSGNAETTSRIVRLSAAQIASPTASILADTTATYIGPAPTYYRYTSNGVSLFGIGYGVTPYQSGIPMMLPGSGSIANNGALTLTTALNAAKKGYFYFPANAIVAGSAAGLYWTEMSTTTLGTIYNNVYVTGIPTYQSAPTAFSTTGPGAYAQTTGTAITLLNVVVPGNTMGANGRIRTWWLHSAANTAGGKTPRLLYGGTSYWNAGLSSYASTELCIDIWNRGVTNSQVGTQLNVAQVFAAQGQPFATGAVNSTVDQILLLDLNIAVATDWACFEAGMVEVLYA
jgi:hypothetical protein